MKKLVIRLSLTLLGGLIITILYEIVNNILLRPTATRIVELQLSDSNSAPVGARIYGMLSFGVLGLSYLAVIILCVYFVVRYLKDKGVSE